MPITFFALYRGIKLQMSPIEWTLLLETMCLCGSACTHTPPFPSLTSAGNLAFLLCNQLSNFMVFYEI